MSDLINIINNLPNMVHLTPASNKDVTVSEEKLNMSFADDYKKYITTFGCISAKGIELTGICEHKRLNVVDVTKSEMTLNPNFPRHMYVIENSGIEGILILQNADGEIFEYVHGEYKKIYNSLNSYLESIK
ncbi:MAG: SMI1/KNR4 family protein [Oscillospiraceae bacterium]